MKNLLLKPALFVMFISLLTLVSTAESWKGVWSMKNNGSLTISKVSNSSFHFAFDCSNGTNIGQLEGDASIKGNFAYYKSGENCPIKFELNDKMINVKVLSDENPNCFYDAGNGVYYDGTYKGRKEESTQSGKSVIGSFDSFWNEFQTAVVKVDKNKLVELSIFPMGEIPGITGNEIEGKTTEKEFVSKLKKIFDKRNTESIKKTKANNLTSEKDYYTGEQVYQLNLNYGDKYLGWSFIFGIRDGKYKLIRIDVAG